MLTETQRLQQVVAHIDNLLQYMVKMPLAFMKCRKDAETFTQHMLVIRAKALGASIDEAWQMWIQKRYLEIEDPVMRSVTEAGLRRYPHDEVQRDRFYLEEMAKLVYAMKKEMEEQGNE